MTDAQAKRFWFRFRGYMCNIQRLAFDQKMRQIAADGCLPIIVYNGGACGLMDWGLDEAWKLFRGLDEKHGGAELRKVHLSALE